MSPNTKKTVSRVRSTSSSSSQKQLYYSDGEDQDQEEPVTENERPSSDKEDDLNDIEFSNLLRRPRPMSFPYALNEPPDEFANFR